MALFPHLQCYYWCLSHHRPKWYPVVIITLSLAPSSSHPGGAEFKLGNVFLSKPPKSLLRGKGNGFSFQEQLNVVP